MPNGAKALKTHLAEVDERCPACDYSLKNCPSDRCPECGISLRLQITTSVASAGPWWLTGVFGLALSCLFALVTTYHIMVDLWNALSDPRIPAMVQAGMVPSTALPDWRDATLYTLLTCICFFLLAVLIHSRIRFAERPTAARILLGIAGALSPVGMVGLFALLAAFA